VTGTAATRPHQPIEITMEGNHAPNPSSNPAHGTGGSPTALPGAAVGTVAGEGASPVSPAGVGVVGGFSLFPPGSYRPPSRSFSIGAAITVSPKARNLLWGKRANKVADKAGVSDRELALGLRFPKAYELLGVSASATSPRGTSAVSFITPKEHNTVAATTPRGSSNNTINNSGAATHRGLGTDQHARLHLRSQTANDVPQPHTARAGLTMYQRQPPIPQTILQPHAPLHPPHAASPPSIHMAEPSPLPIHVSVPSVPFVMGPETPLSISTPSSPQGAALGGQAQTAAAPESPLRRAVAPHLQLNPQKTPNRASGPKFLHSWAES
jgi:hypothetical protein